MPIVLLLCAAGHHCSVILLVYPMNHGGVQQATRFTLCSVAQKCWLQTLLLRCFPRNKATHPLNGWQLGQSILTYRSHLPIRVAVLWWSRPELCPVLNNLLADEQASAAAAGKHRLEGRSKPSNCASCPMSLVWLLKGRSGVATTQFSSSSCSSSISMHNDSTKLMLHCLRSARIQHIINSPCSISPSMGAGVGWTALHACWHKLLLH
jgi:hypothetical protein